MISRALEEWTQRHWIDIHILVSLTAKDLKTHFRLNTWTALLLRYAHSKQRTQC